MKIQGYSATDLYKGFSIDVFNHALGRGQVIGNSTIVTTTDWPVANKAFYWPIHLPYPALITHFWYWAGNSAGLTGNIDVGLFNYVSGAKIASTGATSLVGRQRFMTFTAPATGTFVLLPGQYWMGVSLSTTTNCRLSYYASSLAGAQAIGGAQETSAHPLPATITPAQVSGTVVYPAIGMKTNYAAHLT